MLKIKNEYKLILDIIDEVHKSIAFNVNTNAERKTWKYILIIANYLGWFVIKK